ncbi:MAG TPA: tRNA pseudouridine(38-40) synthase TruA [Bacillota bacterium]|nr:tRNA pseudouridine(38-40) synthase TruA [Bacillota bacterium]HQE01916.1 tRNA pseudouridine(38-40) synthase TruA [Bacillota bacterium]
MAGRIEGRVALVMEYDGANYAGWQLQHNADTVQARVEKALGHLFGCPVSVRAASRTDSGVHARGQVVALDLPRPFPPEKLAPALNWHLPADIRVVRACTVPRDFDPRTWAVGKIYRYCLFTRRASSAFVSRYCWHLPGELDVAAMNSGARYLIGSHDFASFQAAGSSVRDTRRTIRHLFCRRQGPLVTITCVGDGFLYKMVRIIVGSLVEIGLGRHSPDWLGQVLAGRDRQLAGPTAPAHGLVLERVLYRPSLSNCRRPW